MARSVRSSGTHTRVQVSLRRPRYGSELGGCDGRPRRRRFRGRSAGPSADPESGVPGDCADGGAVDAGGHGVPLGAVSCGEGVAKFSLVTRLRSSNPSRLTIKANTYRTTAPSRIGLLVVQVVVMVVFRSLNLLAIGESGALISPLAGGAGPAGLAGELGRVLAETAPLPPLGELFPGWQRRTVLQLREELDREEGAAPLMRARGRASAGSGGVGSGSMPRWTPRTGHR